MLQQIYGDNTMSHTCVFESHKKFQMIGRPLRSRNNVTINQVKLVMCGDRPLTEWMIATQLEVKMENLEDNHWIFLQTESQNNNCVKTANWYSEGVRHPGVSRHHQATSNWTRLSSSSHYLGWDGFLSTNLKPSVREVKGSLWRCQNRRKQNSQSQKSKSCWSHSLSTAGSCHIAWRSISKSTRRYYGVYFTKCARRKETCGRTNH